MQYMNNKGMGHGETECLDFNKDTIYVGKSATMLKHTKLSWRCWQWKQWKVVWSSVYDPSLYSMLHPIQWVPGALSLGVKVARAWSWPLASTSAKVKEWMELYLHALNTPSWRGAQLKKAQGQLYLLPRGPNNWNR
jgi:hypothetical protein